MKSSFFINLQTLYDQALPRQIAIGEREILKKVPYSEMAKLGWLPKTLKVDEKLKNLYGFFGIANLNLLSQVGAGAIAFRKKETGYFSKESLACWLRKGEIDAMQSRGHNFDKKKLENNLNDIRILTKKPLNEVRSVLHEILADSGIILSLTPKLTNSCVNGASRWFGNSVLIQVSDSGKKEDIFWFTLFHELGHAIKHLFKSKKLDFIDLEDSDKDPSEIEADEFAKNTLIPENNYSIFIKQAEFTQIKILDFADSIGVDSGIVVGRLQHDTHIEWAQMQDLRRKILF